MSLNSLIEINRLTLTFIRELKGNKKVKWLPARGRWLSSFSNFLKMSCEDFNVAQITLTAPLHAHVFVLTHRAFFYDLIWVGR